MQVGLTPLERLALMTAALCHDMEHPGACLHRCLCMPMAWCVPACVFVVGVRGVVWWSIHVHRPKGGAKLLATPACMSPYVCGREWI